MNCAKERELFKGGLNFVPIGYVHSTYTDPTPPHIHKIDFSHQEATIELLPEYAPGLAGYDLCVGKEFHIFYYFHMTTAVDLKIHPRGNTAVSKRGVFATHCCNRPNHIGITKVEILSYTENTVTVRGLDAIDGSPVLDIKPISRIGNHPK